ncbi:MAG: ATP-binding protein [Oscillospiraceae bacterium]|nr:ATP-binding protein [Oscillospiraceae bacterium]
MLFTKKPNTPQVPAVSDEQIEVLNLRRIVITCACVLSFEILNILNPSFWAQPLLWPGTIYLCIISVAFLLAVLYIRQKCQLHSPARFYILFWSLLIIGMFPFLVRDARHYELPMNCVLLAAILICAPLLQLRDLRAIFLTAGAVNLVAVIVARHATPLYYVEVVLVNALAFWMSRDLHGRYYALLEQQQRHYNDALQARLQQQALQAELESEKDSNSAKTEFLSRMSHDLRTPLNGVIGCASLALDDSISRTEVNEYLREINQSGIYLLSLINDVLDMSKINSNKMVLHPEPYCAAEFAMTMKSVIGEQCRMKGIDFSITTPDRGNEWLMLDKLRFNQVFMNLLSNAIKFTPRDGRIDLIVEHLSQTGTCVRTRFTVKDSGVGMHPDYLAKAFEPFSQERGSDSQQGAGLGLSIVKSIVTLMGGDVHIESAPGQGTSVIVELTLQIAKNHAAAPALPPVDLRVLVGKRVLLCEDHPTNTQIAIKLLERRGIETEHAPDGQRGLEMFQASAPGYYDAILMDVRMPVMNGLDATHAIRKLDRADAVSIPIIAMTANAFEEDRLECLRAGMDAHVSKPINPDLLDRALVTFLPHDVR